MGSYQPACRPTLPESAARDTEQAPTKKRVGDSRKDGTYRPSLTDAAMPTEPLSDYHRIEWAGRFRHYTDAMLLKRWQQSDEEPDETDLLCLAEIEKRGLDI